jgi:hypothetical protein
MHSKVRSYIIPVLLFFYILCSVISFLAVQKPQSPTPTPRPILDAYTILGATRAEIETLLGPSVPGIPFTLVPPLPDQDPIPNHTAVYTSAPYRLQVSFDAQDIARGLLVYQGIEDFEYSLQQCKQVLSLLMIEMEGPPRTTATTCAWENQNGYNILLTSKKPGSPVSSVQILYRTPINGEK